MGEWRLEGVLIGILELELAVPANGNVLVVYLSSQSGRGRERKRWNNGCVNEPSQFKRTM